MSAGGADGEERPPEARTGDAKPDDGAAPVDAAITNGTAGSDAARGNADGSTGPKAKKASLDDIIKGLKQEKEALKKSKKELAKTLKQANRKRRRLKKRASALSQGDLFELCRMRNLNPEAMEQEEEDLYRAANIVAAERTAAT